MCNINDKIRATSYILAKLKENVTERIEDGCNEEVKNALLTLSNFLEGINLNNIKSEQIGEIYNLLYCICIASLNDINVNSTESMFQIFDKFYVSDNKDLIENDLQTNNFYLFLNLDKTVLIELKHKNVLDSAINAFCNILIETKKTLVELFGRIKNLGTYVSALNYYGRLQTNASELKKDYRTLFA